MTSTQTTLMVGCVVGLCGAGAALACSRYERSVQAYYGTQPQQLSVASLTKQAPSRHWVELNNVQLGPRAVVSAPRGSIDTIWLPVFPLNSAERAPIHAVLRSSKSHSLEDFSLRLRDRLTFRGSIQEVTTANSSLRSQLASNYPGYPLANQIWEVDIDFGGPSYLRWAQVLHSASGGLLVFGVICLLGFVG